MNVKDKEVYSDDFLSIYQRYTNLNPDNPYTFLFEKRSNGKLVVILPFRRNENGELEFLIRKETVIVWNPNEKYTVSITGGVEDDDPHKTAVMELAEEGGYITKFENFIYLGYTKIAKHANTNVFMYAIDLTNMKRTTAYSDGSDMEKIAFSYWSDNIGDVESTILYKILYRLFEMNIISPCEYFKKDKKISPKSNDVGDINTIDVEIY